MKRNSTESLPGTGISFLRCLSLAIALLVFLAWFSIGPIKISHPVSEHNWTIASHAVVKSGLEEYFKTYGHYPTPAHPDAMIELSGRGIRVGGARMLYQVLTGDGDNEIKSASATASVSDGKVSEEESERGINPNLPKRMVAKSEDGYYLVDGWGRPFQYTRGGDGDALNATYDLWSSGPNDSSTPLVYDAASRRNAETTAKWIKNW